MFVKQTCLGMKLRVAYSIQSIFRENMYICRTTIEFCKQVISLSVCMYFCMHCTACFQKCNLISAYVMRYETDMIITCIVGLGDVCGFFWTD